MPARKNRFGVPRKLDEPLHVEDALQSIGRSMEPHSPRKGKGVFSRRRHLWALKGLARRVGNAEAKRRIQQAFKDWYDAGDPRRPTKPEQVALRMADHRYRRFMSGPRKTELKNALAQRDYEIAHHILINAGNFVRSPAISTEHARRWEVLLDHAVRRPAEGPARQNEYFLSEILYNAIHAAEKAELFSSARRMSELGEVKGIKFLTVFDRSLSAKQKAMGRALSVNRIYRIPAILRSLRDRCLITRDFIRLSDEWLELADEFEERAERYEIKLDRIAIQECVQQAHDLSVLGRDSKQVRYILAHARVRRLAIETNPKRARGRESDSAR